MKRLMIVVALLLVAIPLAAQSGRMPGMRGSGDLGSMMSGMTVGPDATVYVMRHVNGSTNAYELAAIRPSGTVAWTAPLNVTGATQVAVNSTTVFVSSFGTMGTFPNLAIKSQIIGFNAASGAKVFANDLDGIAVDLDAFNDGVYVLEVAMNGAGMMTNIGRKLVSVSNTGKTNFSLPLD